MILGEINSLWESDDRGVKSFFVGWIRVIMPWIRVLVERCLVGCTKNCGLRSFFLQPFFFSCSLQSYCHLDFSLRLLKTAIGYFSKLLLSRSSSSSLPRSLRKGKKGRKKLHSCCISNSIIKSQVGGYKIAFFIFVDIK